MLKFIIYLSLVAMTSSVMADDCSEDLNELYNKKEVRQSSNKLSKDLHTLRQAAITMQNRGDEDGCEEIVEIMEETIEEYEDEYDDKKEEQRLSNAKEVNKGTGAVLAENITGSAIYNTKGKDLGNIEAVAIDTTTGKVSYIVVSYGGFIGLGNKNIAIPWQQLLITEDGETYVTNMSEMDLENAPDLGDDALPNVNVLNKIRARNQLK